MLGFIYFSGLTASSELPNQLSRLKSTSAELVVFQVYAGARYCGVINYEEGKDVYSVDCDGAVANFVQIEQDNDYLTLCEVEVFGTPSDKLALENVAIGKLEIY